MQAGPGGVLVSEMMPKAIRVLRMVVHGFVYHPTCECVVTLLSLEGCPLCGAPYELIGVEAHA